MNFTSNTKKNLTNNRMVLPYKKGNITSGLKDVSRVNTNDSNYVPTGDGDCLAKDFSKISLQPRVDAREEIVDFLELKEQRKFLFDEELRLHLIDTDDIEKDIDLIEIPCPLKEEKYEIHKDDNANNTTAIDNFYNLFYENLSLAINEYNNSDESEKYAYESLDTFDCDSGRGSSIEIPKYEFDQILEDNGSNCDIEIEL
uniref:39S ribosomal protein L51, mitochondrial n=1 Tax=Strongyloides stercoralis TaxID=6248 RepID=A0A0K0DUP2_STRER